MGMIKEFKDFAMRGNVVDLAVGVVIGAAFGQIVTTLVSEIIMPIVGYLQGGIDFKDFKVNLPVPELAEGVKAPTLGVGMLIQTIINFIIVAFVIFLAVKMMNSMKKKEEAAPTPPPEDVVLLREIRDALKQR